MQMVKKAISIQLLNELAAKRPVFHSEDDFKFSLAQFVCSESESVRLEVPQKINLSYRSSKKKHNSILKYFDMVIFRNGKKIPVELKYKTKKHKESDAYKDENLDELFSLKDQGARTEGLFSFRKDIYRIEKFLESNNDSEEGYVVILTNDNNYRKAQKENTIAFNYSFHNGATIEGRDFGWNYNGEKKNHWTTKGDKSMILDLNGSYKIKWEKYENDPNAPDFYFLIIQVKNKFK